MYNIHYSVHNVCYDRYKYNTNNIYSNYIDVVIYIINYTK